MESSHAWAVSGFLSYLSGQPIWILVILELGAVAGVAGGAGGAGAVGAAPGQVGAVGTLDMVSVTGNEVLS